MSIQSEINRINTNIASAYDKCEEKGATMPDNENSANLADTIDSIPTGGGGSGEDIPDGYCRIRFLDYDGTIISSETVPVGSSYSEPTPPDHTNKGIEFFTWNQTFDTSSADYSRDIGAMYTPSGQYNIFVVDVNEENGFTFTFGIGAHPTAYAHKYTLGDMWDYSIDWGDGSAVETGTHTGTIPEQSDRHIIEFFKHQHTFTSAGKYIVKVASFLQGTDTSRMVEESKMAYYVFGDFSGSLIGPKSCMYKSNSLTSLTECKVLTEIFALMPEASSFYADTLFGNCPNLSAFLAGNKLSNTTTSGNGKFGNLTNYGRIQYYYSEAVNFGLVLDYLNAKGLNSFSGSISLRNNMDLTSTHENFYKTNHIGILSIGDGTKYGITSAVYVAGFQVDEVVVPKEQIDVSVVQMGSIKKIRHNGNINILRINNGGVILESLGDVVITDSVYLSDGNFAGNVTLSSTVSACNIASNSTTMSIDRKSNVTLCSHNIRNFGLVNIYAVDSCNASYSIGNNSIVGSLDLSGSNSVSTKRNIAAHSINLKRISKTSFNSSIFENNYSAESYIFPDTLTDWNLSYAFSNNYALEEVDIPAISVSSCEYTFSKCSSLRRVSFSDSASITKTYFSHMFYSCNNLILIHLPSDMSISSNASLGYMFGECQSLPSDVIEDVLSHFSDISIEYLCHNNGSIRTSFAFPNSIVSITGGSNVFFYCNDLAKLWIPSSVATIKTSYSSYSPISGAPSTLHIYCEAPSKPSGWGQYWNCYNGSSYIPDSQIHWGATRAEYDAA